MIIEKVKCPHCGYEMPVWYDPKKAESKGIYTRCKGRDCRREFEIKIKASK